MLWDKFSWDRTGLPKCMLLSKCAHPTATDVHAHPGTVCGHRLGPGDTTVDRAEQTTGPGATAAGRGHRQNRAELLSVCAVFWHKAGSWVLVRV